ncbi:MAG TPA: hypothetical protein VH500_17065 [Nitrososphaeraceae archaeon]
MSTIGLDYYTIGASISKDSNRNMLSIENIFTQQKEIHVGDSFTLQITVKNSSPNFVFIQLSKCLGKPVSINFMTNNVRKVVKICNISPLLDVIKPGGSSVVNSTMFKAIDPGSAEGIATISYATSSNSHFNKSVSKGFSISILTMASS